MSKRRTFIDRCLLNEVFEPLKEVDNTICEWHRSTTGMSLEEWLGMTEKEYAIFINDPSVLLDILAERRRFLA